MKLDAVQQAAQEQFARRSHRYGRGHILENVEDVRAAIEPLQLAPGSRVLDVATGAGHTGLFLASLGHDVTLTDIAAPMLERATEAATRRGLKVQTRQHPAEQFPYADDSFDLVTCRVAPHHFSSPESFIRELPGCSNGADISCSLTAASRTTNPKRRNGCTRWRNFAIRAITAFSPRALGAGSAKAPV